MRFSFGKALLPIYTVLALIFLLIPIGYTFAFSFNKSDKSNNNMHLLTIIQEFRTAH